MRFITSSLTTSLLHSTQKHLMLEQRDFKKYINVPETHAERTAEKLRTQAPLISTNRVNESSLFDVDIFLLYKYNII